MHLRQPTSLDKSEFTYSAYGPFTKKQRKNTKFMETGYSRYFYQNELDKACF